MLADHRLSPLQYRKSYPRQFHSSMIRGKARCASSQMYISDRARQVEQVGYLVENAARYS